MSLVTEVVEGKITPEQFVSSAAADLKKDLALFQAVPGFATLAAWAVSQLVALLAKSKLSPTMIALVEAGLSAELLPAHA